MAWKPLPGTPRPPRPLAKGLQGVLRHAGGPDGPLFARIVREWPDLVGADLAAVCRPLRCTNGALVLVTDDAAAASDLRWRGAELAALVNEATRSTAITRVDVIVRRTR